MTQSIWHCNMHAYIPCCPKQKKTFGLHLAINETHKREITQRWRCFSSGPGRQIADEKRDRRTKTTRIHHHFWKNAWFLKISVEQQSLYSCSARSTEEWWKSGLQFKSFHMIEFVLNKDCSSISVFMWRSEWLCFHWHCCAAMKDKIKDKKKTKKERWEIRARGMIKWGREKRKLTIDRLNE